MKKLLIVITLLVSVSSFAKVIEVEISDNVVYDICKITEFNPETARWEWENGVTLSGESVYGSEALYTMRRKGATELSEARRELHLIALELKEEGICTKVQVPRRWSKSSL